MRKILVSFLLVLSACASTTRLSEQAYAAKAAGSPVEVFYKEKPARAYEQLAVIEDDSILGHETNSTIQKMKDRARAMGGDGIIVENASNGEPWIQGTGPNVKVIVIRWKEAK